MAGWARRSGPWGVSNAGSCHLVSRDWPPWDGSTSRWSLSCSNRKYESLFTGDERAEALRRLERVGSSLRSRQAAVASEDLLELFEVVP